MNTLTMYGITYSPWTYKARWALAWHRLDYRYKEYVVMLSKPLLRLRLNRWSKPITAPLAVVNGQILDSSLKIAQWADEQGAGSSLHMNHADVKAWDHVADEFMQLGRFRLTHGYASDARALKAAVPPVFQRMPGALFLGKMGLRYMKKTYPLDVQPETVEDQMAERLRAVRAGLKDREHFLSGPSYADISVACALQMVDPVEDALLPLAPEARPHWSSTRLTEEFADLLQWRDGIFSTLGAPRIGEGAGGSPIRGSE